MFCFNCGKEVKEGVRFCEFCGQQLDSNIEKKQEPQIVYVKQPKEPKSVFIALVLLLLFGFFGFHDFYMGKSNRAVAKLLITVLLGWLFYIGLIINFLWCLFDFFTVVSKDDPCFYTEEAWRKLEQQL